VSSPVPPTHYFTPTGSVPFAVFDCRHQLAYEASHLSGSTHVDPALLAQPERLVEFIANYGALKVCVRVGVLGVGGVWVVVGGTATVPRQHTRGRCSPRTDRVPCLAHYKLRSAEGGSGLGMRICKIMCVPYKLLSPFLGRTHYVHGLWTGGR
jgi:hypothetical protein